MKKIFLIIFCVVVTCSNELNATQFSSGEVMSVDTIKGMETKSRFMPTGKRYDRKVDNIKFAFKGEFLLGTTVSYGNISTDDSEVLLVVDGITANATYTTVKPFVGYFYKDNRCIGLRYGYNYIDAALESGEIDLGSDNDIQFDIPYIGTSSKGHSVGVFHRSYIGLDKKGKIGLFAEVELLGTTTNSTTAYESSGDYSIVKNETLKLELGFNPGAAVYILPNVCATLSFGFGGVNLKSIKQYDENDAFIGERTSSKMSFKFDVTAINIGVSIHLWGKK